MNWFAHIGYRVLYGIVALLALVSPHVFAAGPTAIAIFSAAFGVLISQAITLHVAASREARDAALLVSSLLIEVTEQSAHLERFGTVLTKFDQADTFIFLDGLDGLEPPKSTIFGANAGKLAQLPPDVSRHVYRYYAKLENWRAELLRLPNAEKGKPAENGQVINLRNDLGDVVNAAINAISKLRDHNGDAGGRSDLGVADAMLPDRLKNLHDDLKKYP